MFSFLETTHFGFSVLFGVCILFSVLLISNENLFALFKAALPPLKGSGNSQQAKFVKSCVARFYKRACVNGLIFDEKSGVYRHRLCLLSTPRTAVLE